MTRPLPAPRRGSNPGQVFLRAFQLTDSELRQILTDAAEEAARVIPKLLERNTLGGQLRAAQLAITLREVHSLLAGMWGDYLPVLRAGLRGVALVAVKFAAEDLIWSWLRARGARPADLAILKQAIVHQQRPRIDAVAAKASNGIPLSTAVYHTQKLAEGWVDRKIRTALVLGKNAQELAADVREAIDPNVRGGVSYAAMRLARTEINNAYHTLTIATHASKPWTTGFEWHLSRSHPHRDGCDLLVGFHDKGQVPAKPHPQCFCYVTQRQVDEDTWIDNFVAGLYDHYLDEEISALDSVHAKVDRPASGGQVVQLDRARQNRQAAARRRRGKR